VTERFEFDEASGSGVIHGEPAVRPAGQMEGDGVRAFALQPTFPDQAGQQDADEGIGAWLQGGDRQAGAGLGDSDAAIGIILH
jgi:hypothetical protein